MNWHWKLVTFLFLLSCVSVFSGSFKPPRESERINGLESEMRSMKDLLNQLKARGDQSSDRSRFSSLEASVEELQRQIDDERKKVTAGGEVSSSMMQEITQSVNVINRELDDIKEKFRQKEMGEAKRMNIEYCIHDIESQRFAEAEERLEAVSSTDVNRIVKKVYNNNLGNFNLILTFAEKIKNIPRSFYVFSALAFEMETNGHVKDHVKMVKYLQSIRKEVLNQQRVKNETKKEAENIEEKFKNYVKQETKEILKQALLNDNYDSTKTISDIVHEYSNALFKKSLKEAISDVYHKVDLERIIKSISKHSYYEEMISGIRVIFDEIKKRSDLNNQALFSLAYEIKDIEGASNYYKIHEEIRASLSDVKMKLPRIVRNVVFSRNLCIKTSNGVKFYASNSFGDVTIFTERRRIVKGSEYDTDFDSTYRWRIDRHDDGNFYIKNNGYDEFLYMASGAHDNRAYTWAHDGMDTDMPWSIILQDNDKYLIKNNHHEYCLSYMDFMFGNTILQGDYCDKKLVRVEDCY